MADNTTIYVCEAHPSFSFRVGEKRFRCEKHVLRVTDEASVEDIDAMMEKFPIFAQKLKKVSKAAAEDLVLEHMRTHGGAVKGMFSSEHSPAKIQPLRERDAAFAALDPQAVDTITAEMVAKNELVLTEKSKGATLAGAAAAGATNINATTSVRSAEAHTVK